MNTAAHDQRSRSYAGAVNEIGDAPRFPLHILRSMRDDRSDQIDQEPLRRLPHGSTTNRSRPSGLSVFASKVRTSSVPPISTVTTMRSPATAVETTRAPLGSSVVASTGP